MLIKRSPNGIDSPFPSEITPQSLYEERRRFIKRMALGAAASRLHPSITARPVP